MLASVMPSRDRIDAQHNNEEDFIFAGFVSGELMGYGSKDI